MEESDELAQCNGVFINTLNLPEMHYHDDAFIGMTDEEEDVNMVGEEEVLARLGDAIIVENEEQENEDDTPAVNMDAVHEVLARLEGDEDAIVVEEGAEQGNAVFRFAADRTIVIEGQNGSGSVDDDIVPEPAIGMTFEMGEQFISYVHRYANSAGFGARIYGSDRVGGGVGGGPVVMKIVDNVLISGYADYCRIRMCCRKEGKHDSRSKDPNRSVLTCKTGCRYLVNARRNPSMGNPWKITSVRSLHNHSMNVGGSRFIPRYRTISPGDQINIIELHKANVGSAKIFDMFVNKFKGYNKVPFREVDLENFLAIIKRPVKDCDFAEMEGHFKKMREQSPGFFYDFQVDEDYKMKNVFWADERCKESFQCFGDVVSFDTTFVSNRYTMPFAVFVGTNHSGRTILFGCALIRSEDTDSFVWLFRTWKKFMQKAPLRILTDQDAAIGKAIQIVFPDCKHRWCIWHVMKNGRKHLGNREDWGQVYGSLQNVLHDSVCVPEFEERWVEWVKKYDVGENSWVIDMYRLRARWCPVFFKTDFWAGMSSTQRSEGMHHYFKGYVSVNTSLADFVLKYGKAICRRIGEEENQINRDEDLHAIMTTAHPFEPYFDSLLTRAKFKEMHVELKHFAQNVATKVSETDTEVVYEVLVKTFRVDWAKKRTYRVVFRKETLDVECECKNFEFRGILCAHALRVFWMEDILELPAKYVMERWRRDIPRKYVTILYPEEAVIGSVPGPAQRYKEIMGLCEEIGEMVMNDEVMKNEVVGMIKSMKEKIEKEIGLPAGIGSYMKGTIGRVFNRGTVREKEAQATVATTPLVEVPRLVRDPDDRRGRGKAPTKRKLAFGERRGRKKTRRADAGTSKNNDGGTPVGESSYRTPVKMVLGNLRRSSFQMNPST